MLIKICCRPVNSIRFSNINYPVCDEVNKKEIKFIASFDSEMDKIEICLLRVYPT